MTNDGPIFIDINMPDEEDSKPNSSSYLDELTSLTTLPSKKKSKEIVSDDDSSKPVLITTKHKKKKKKKKTSLSELEDEFEDGEETENTEDELLDLDIEEILARKEDPDNEDIIKDEKEGYKKKKKDKNEYKKEFAEELTLLYTLLDETNKFSKELEKKYKDTTGQKVRGISKYTTDLAQAVLSSKQSKLAILKEIAGIKKTIADLSIKEGKTSKAEDGLAKSPEYLASSYFKNVLSHGRSDFINRLTSEDDDYEKPNFSSMIENSRNNSRSDDEELMQRLQDRLFNSDVSDIRSDAGSKYIEYENRDVKIYVKKCVDTGEWEFIAIDKYNEVVEDYPLPTKREAGRMKFSDDGTYCTDSRSRMYKVIEYYLPDEDEEEDDD